MDAQGGFLRSALPSPPHSKASTVSSPLPKPRTDILKPLSAKESRFVDYVDAKLLHVSGSFERRLTSVSNDAVANDQAQSQGADANHGGYQNFAGLAKDLQDTVDIVWVSGTPSLQIPFLLNIADSITTYIVAFPFAPKPTFQLLHKLDYAFTSMLKGIDIDSGESLPGFDRGRRITQTEKVRLMGIIERTRVQIVGVAAESKERNDRELTESGFTTDDDPSETTQTMDESWDDRTGDEDDPRPRANSRDWDWEWDMEIAKVYDGTIVALNMSLESSAGS